ncbi:ras-interacting protein 1 isoform X1 [Silurus asotus]|uniref:Ras-interacting protein 1 isoform X1 n=1 Tax=Silurus asotus TaxID=30991 RepID=A0AAD5AQ52_SILAS|nr:ras-interacting protein 1 isoform X1 [Silurus asotus]
MGFKPVILKDIGVVQNGGEGNSVSKNNGPASLSIGTDQERKKKRRSRRKQKRDLLELSTTSSEAASVPDAPPPAPSTALSFSSPSISPPSPSPNRAVLRPRPANQQSRAKRLSHLFLKGRSNSDRDRAVGEREREVWAHSATPSLHHYLPPASSSAPGLVKIYGDALSSGANYRSLLANIHSTARQLIQQVINRYTERERENESDDIALQKHSPEDFLLCDVIGKPIQHANGAVQWQTECRRGVAPWECPLLLVDMWRPKEGFERRFEIQRRDEYEREEKEKEKERSRDGENSQVRWRRSRMSSGGGLDEERGHRGRNTELRRSISDMNLTLRRRQGNQANNDSRRSGNATSSGEEQDRKNIVSMIATELGQVSGSRVVSEAERRAAEDDKDSCDLEVMSQSLILPPTDRPYFLLLQGYDQSKARHAAQPYHTAPNDIMPALTLSQHTIASFIPFRKGIEHTAQNI